ncbi:MAG: DUF3782 domain-containing protein, partial [bacterium]
MIGRVLKFKEEEEHILKALPALLRKDVWFRREVSVILSEIFSTKGELKQMFEESRISREEAKRQNDIMECKFEASNRRFDALLQKMQDGFDLQRQEIKELDAKVDNQGQAIKELDVKVDNQGQAIKELDAKFDKLDAKVDDQGQAIKDLDVKFDKLDAKVDDQGQAIKELDVKFDKLDAKVDRSVKILDSKIDKMTIKMDTLGSRWGIFAESTIRNTLRELLTKHLDVEEITEWKVHDKDGVVFGYPQDVQIDFLIKNGTEYLGEIKSSAGSADVSILFQKAKFYTQITGKSPKVLLVAVSV